MDNAWRLKGKLLLINGELDDNVDPASTLQVVSELMKANKNFDQLYLPGKTHSLGGPFEMHKMHDFFVKNLMGELNGRRTSGMGISWNEKPGKSLREHIWCIKSPVARLREHIWCIKSPVARSRGHIWWIKSSVARSRGHIWWIKSPVARSRGHIWWIKSPVARSRAGTFDGSNHLLQVCAGRFGLSNRLPQVYKGVPEKRKNENE